MVSNSACEYSSLSSHFAALVSARMESEGREKEGIRPPVWINSIFKLILIGRLQLQTLVQQYNRLQHVNRITPIGNYKYERNFATTEMTILFNFVSYYLLKAIESVYEINNF